MDPMDYIVRIGNLKFSCSWIVVGAVAMQSHAASAPQNQPVDSLATRQANLERPDRQLLVS